MPDLQIGMVVTNRDHPLWGEGTVIGGPNVVPVRTYQGVADSLILWTVMTDVPRPSIYPLGRSITTQVWNQHSIEWTGAWSVPQRNVHFCVECGEHEDFFVGEDDFLCAPCRFDFYERYGWPDTDVTPVTAN